MIGSARNYVTALTLRIISRNFISDVTDKQTEPLTIYGVQ